MKKVILGLVLTCLLFACSNVFAEEIYYINNNGLQFTEFQYKIMTQMIYEENVANLTTDQYKLYMVDKMTPDNTKIAIEEDKASDSDVNPNATYYETNGKRVAIASVCQTTYCRVITANTWKILPKVRSYDVVGIRLANTNFTNANFAASLSTDDNTYGHKSSKGFDNGMGVSFKLPSNETINTIALTVNVEPKGRVYGTYQHAVKSISSDKAMNFEISAGGYGSVLLYPSSYDGYFDQMAGVYIAL